MPVSLDMGQPDRSHAMCLWLNDGKVCIDAVHRMAEDHRICIYVKF